MSTPTERPPTDERSRGDKRDRTRAALLEAARALVRDKGYANTTLAEIAERAGMTTGAIYGNFRNREDLFVALGEAYWTPVRPRVKPGATFAEAMQAMGQATLDAIPERTAAAVGRLTGMAHVLTSEELRERVREVTAADYALGALWLRSFDERELPMPAEQLVCVIHALIEGLVFQRIQTPDLVPDEAILGAFRALAREVPPP